MGTLVEVHFCFVFKSFNIISLSVEGTLDASIVLQLVCAQRLERPCPNDRRTVAEALHNVEPYCAGEVVRQVTAALRVVVGHAARLSCAEQAWFVSRWTRVFLWVSVWEDNLEAPGRQLFCL